MSKNFYLGVGNVARQVKDVYVGVKGVARRIYAGYIGIDGVARLTHGSSSGALAGSCWRFRDDIDYDEWCDYINEHDTSESSYYTHIGVDIRFDVPAGVNCYTWDEDGDEIVTMAYEFRRMEFHNNSDEGGYIYYYAVDENIGYADVGDGGEFYVDAARTIILNEAASAELLDLLNTFAVLVE